MFNKTFKMTFKKLILCRYDTLQRKTRVQNWLLNNGISHYPMSSSTVHNADVMLTIKNGAQQTTNIMNTIPITLDAFCSVWTSSVFMLAALSSS
jgi:hypothetical protein